MGYAKVKYRCQGFSQESTSAALLSSYPTTTPFPLFLFFPGSKPTTRGGRGVRVRRWRRVERQQEGKKERRPKGNYNDEKQSNVFKTFQRIPRNCKKYIGRLPFVKPLILSLYLSFLSPAARCLVWVPYRTLPPTNHPYPNKETLFFLIFRFLLEPISSLEDNTTPDKQTGL